MTPDQAENRDHKLAYIVQDGDVTEEEAHAWMNTLPHEYGRREHAFTQQDIFAPNVSHIQSE